MHDRYVYFDRQIINSIDRPSGRELCFEADINADSIRIGDHQVNHTTKLVRTSGARFDAYDTSEHSPNALGSMIDTNVSFGTSGGRSGDNVLKLPYCRVRQLVYRVGVPLARSLRACETGCLPGRGWCVAFCVESKLYIAWGSGRLSSCPRLSNCKCPC